MGTNQSTISKFESETISDLEKQNTEEEIEYAEEIDFQRGESNIIDVYKKSMPPPPPPPDEDEIIKVVEPIPRIPGCEHLVDNKDDLENCIQNRILEVIYSNLEFPEEAIQNEKHGIAVVQFVLTKNGISETNIIRDPGYGMGEAAEKAACKLESLFQYLYVQYSAKGRLVEVLYTLPIRFSIPSVK